MDNEHAERDAIAKVEDKTRLSEATLYTTLEPCTGEVRSVPDLSCTELILQHEIPKVVIGILDPNQGVAGKGILKLQKHGREVSLFPHGLAQKIRAINAPFIRIQEGLGARIVDPPNGARIEVELPVDIQSASRASTHRPPIVTSCSA